MLSRFRRHRGFWRAIAILLVATGWATPLVVPHSSGDDPICLVATSSEAESRIGGFTAAAPQPEHCVVCHVARSFRSAAAASGRLIVAITPGQLLEFPSDRFGGAPSLVRLPARAPPA